ncbi:hypothetical protein KC866_01915 [Patescibacteria group bacterium]|nr:hypothetical protein [Patescibacteria group bacterium]
MRNLIDSILNGKQPVAQEGNVIAYELTPQEYRELRKQTSAQTTIPVGATTKEHTHEHKSFYLSKKLDVIVGVGKKLLKLPKLALSIIPQGTIHPWQNNSGEDGEVCDVYTGTFIHEKHVIL